MPVVRIELSSGRTAEQKKKTAVAVTKAIVEHCNCSPESVHVVFFDVPNTEWAVAGRFLSEPKPKG